MPLYDQKIIHVTEQNIAWAAKQTGKSEVAIQTELNRCKELGVVCTMEVKTQNLPTGELIQLTHENLEQVARRTGRSLQYLSDALAQAEERGGTASIRIPEGK